MTKRTKTGGRQQGTPNKENKALREMILQALTEQPGGGVEYFKKQAFENPGAFMTILGKILPTQVSGDQDNPVGVIHTIRRVIIGPDGIER